MARKGVTLKLVSRLIELTLYPGILLLTLVTAGSMLALGMNETLITFATIIVAGAIVMLVQLYMPHREDWRVGHYEVNVDLKHLLFTAVVFPALTQATLFGALVWMSVQMTAWMGTSLWPQDLPLIAQLGCALVIGDLGFYLAHRAMHKWDWLWRIHSVHHSSESLYFFSATRLHPLNFLLTYLAPMAPLVLLGAGPELLAFFSVFTAINGGLQHANIRVRLGPLNWILATCDLHRRHHSTDLAESNTNFSSNVIFWDMVFGTRYLPKDKPLDQVGLDGITIPPTLTAHWLTPWRWKELQDVSS